MREQEVDVNIDMPDVQGPCDTSIGQRFYPDSLYEQLFSLDARVMMLVHSIEERLGKLTVNS